MTDRFKKILEDLNLTASEFADRIGVQRSSVSHILSGRNKPSIDFLEKILATFPDTDIHWLISGKASPVRSFAKQDEMADSTGTAENPEELSVYQKTKTPVMHEAGPVEKIIIVYRNNTFRILTPSVD